MNFPTISEYIQAIKYASDNLDSLSYLSAVLDANGDPIMSSGGFSVVFKMQDKHTGKFHALKCFLREQEGREKAYSQISDYLSYVNSPYLVRFRYCEKELFVDNANCSMTEFPVLLMEWVDGVTLDSFIRRCDILSLKFDWLVYRFSELVNWLIKQPFAHGDLKPDNIIVKKDGSLVLIDYDGMYVPSMRGSAARELGTPPCRHPNRTLSDFGPHIDDFAICVVMLSLYGGSKFHTLNQIIQKEGLLFQDNDYKDLGKSRSVHEIMDLCGDSVLCRLFGVFLMALGYCGKIPVNTSVNLFNIPEPPLYVEDMDVIISDMQNTLSLSDINDILSDL